VFPEIRDETLMFSLEVEHQRLVEQVRIPRNNPKTVRGRKARHFLGSKSEEEERKVRRVGGFLLVTGKGFSAGFGSWSLEPSWTARWAILENCHVVCGPSQHVLLHCWESRLTRY
jgi:hypothetical protein